MKVDTKGPAGVYFLWRLAMDPATQPNSTLCLFEQLHRPGGRVASITNVGEHGDLVVEPGAAEGGAGRCLLEDAVEVVLARDVTAVDATEKVATAVGLQGGDSGESLHATAPTCAGIISGDADLAATVDWLPVAAVLLGAADTAASEGGLAVKEGALIYVRDVRQKLPPPKRSTAPERGVSIRREGTARDGQASAVTGGPGAPPLPPPLPGGGAPRAPPPPPPLPP